ncbi:MAG: exo-alpha-sialidase [Bacteroidota bacterium]|nr:exo-alpha-sialidase [Bacteroidota bacterium]
MKSYFLLLNLLMLNLILASQNVMISNEGTPNEPSIMMNPYNQAYLVAGSNTNNYYLSSDTGRTWTVHTLNSSYGVWGDPSINVDTAGHFYFFHLSNYSGGTWIDRIVCQKSEDNGNSWSDGSYTGLNGTKAQDKEWSAVDRSNNTLYLTWTQFDSYGSTATEDSSLIMFSKSTDGGLSWSDAMRISQQGGNCVDNDNTVEGAVPAVGPDGEIYVAWAGPAGLVFNKSTDTGETWLENEISIDPMPGGWAFDIPGISRCNGLPITKCDTSGGEFHGTIYVNWSDQRNGTDDTDVWLSKSMDGGETWSTAVRVNNDPPVSQQFFTWMDIDQSDGTLYFVFYDRREQAGNNTDVYMAVSKDGGITFENIKISESFFLPNSGIFFGDYNNITVHNGIVRPIWTRLHEGQLSVWTELSPLSEDPTGIQEEVEPGEVMMYPNPVSDKAYISFKLHKTQAVSLSLSNQTGSRSVVVFDNKTFEMGKHIIPIDIEQFGLNSGVWYPELRTEEKSTSLKIIVVR